MRLRDEKGEYALRGRGFDHHDGSRTSSFVKIRLLCLRGASGRDLNLLDFPRLNRQGSWLAAIQD